MADRKWGNLPNFARVKMGQAIGKTCSFIIHIVCRIFYIDGNSKKRIHCSSNDDSTCSEPLITASHDSHDSIQTSDNNSSCFWGAVVESTEPLITTTHDFHVISIQTLDDDSSCSSVVVEAIKPLIIATHHDSHAISSQIEDKDHDHNHDHDRLTSDKCNSAKAFGNENENAKAKQITTVAIPREKLWRKVMESTEEPLITTHDSHVISIQAHDDNSSCSSVVVEAIEPLIIATHHDSHAISSQIEDKDHDHNHDHDRLTSDKCNSAKSFGNDNENVKVKQITTVAIPREKAWRKVMESAEEPLITTHDSHVITIQAHDDNSSCSSVAVEAIESLIIATHQDSHAISSQIEDKDHDHDHDRLTSDKYNFVKSSDIDDENVKVKQITTVAVPREKAWRKVMESTDEPLITTHDSYVISIQTDDDNSSCSSVVVEAIEPLIIATHQDSRVISSQIEDKDHDHNHDDDRLTSDKYNSAKSSGNDDVDVKVKQIATVAIPRKKIKRKGKRLMHYCSKHNILLVGEGDFSFSACLAKAFGSAANMVATSLDSLRFLEKNYPSARTNIEFQRNRGCTVLHDMDATKMASNMIVNEYFYDRIIFNFPLAGFFNEPMEQTLKRNRKLVRLFMENAKKLLASDGEIHITHKTSPTYRKWGIENLGKQCRLRLIEDVEFQLSHYPGYNNKYGFGGNGNFDCYPSRTYKFGHE